MASRWTIVAQLGGADAAAACSSSAGRAANRRQLPPHSSAPARRAAARLRLPCSTSGPVPRPPARRQSQERQPRDRGTALQMHRSSGASVDAAHRSTRSGCQSAARGSAASRLPAAPIGATHVLKGYFSAMSEGRGHDGHLCLGRATTRPATGCIASRASRRRPRARRGLGRGSTGNHAGDRRSQRSVEFRRSSGCRRTGCRLLPAYPPSVLAITPAIADKPACNSRAAR